MKKWKVLGVILAFFLLGLGFFLPRFIQTEKDEALKKEILVVDDAVDEDVSEQEIEIDFEKLQKINPDVYAWITIPGTSIDYPVLQAGNSKDEDYYLKHDVYGASDVHGCIYSQKCNSKDFSDPVTVLYGHNMRDGSMFQQLHKYKNESYFDKNSYIEVYTPGVKRVYQVVAAYTMPAELILDKWNGCTEPIDMFNYIQEIKSYAGIYNENVVLSTDSYILTLCTCSGDESIRFVVQGVLIDTHSMA